MLEIIWWFIRDWLLRFRRCARFCPPKKRKSPRRFESTWAIS